MNIENVKWYYTGGELRTLYMDARDRIAEIGIIAELEAKPRELIIEKLKSLGIRIEEAGEAQQRNRVVAQSVVLTQHRKWTPKEDATLRDAVEKGLNIKEIRELFPTRSEHAITQRRSRIGIEGTRVYRKWTTKEDRILKEAYEGGKTMEEIVQMLTDRTAKGIQSRIRKRGWRRK